jgi:cytochrome P450
VPKEGSPQGCPPPGPRAPAALQALRYARQPLGFLTDYRRRYGNVFAISFPYFGRLIYVADPALVKEIFTGSPGQVHAGEANAKVLGPVLGPNSVLTLDEGAHIRQRRLLLPPLHGRRLERHAGLMREATLEDMERWPRGETFALHPHIRRITLAVIMRAVFGIDDRERRLRFERLLDAFSRSLGLIASFPPLRRDLGRWSPWRQFVRARADLDRFMDEEIAARRARSDASERDDVLSLLMGARHEDGSAMSDAELRDELVTILVAGHETTATGLAWAFERLLRSPRALARLRESLAAGEEDYLEATVREILRSRPVIIDVPRKLTAPLRLGAYEVPAGSYVMAAIAALHYREDLFPEPERFLPERFLDAKPNTYSWIPFGGGVRRCVGAAFAEFEMRVVLRTILERVELRTPDPRPEKVKVRSTLVPARGTLVTRL